MKIVRKMPQESLHWRLVSALFAALLLSGCSATDPVLRQAIAEVAKQPNSARIKLRPFAEKGDETAIAQICIAYGRSMDSRVRSPEREQAFAWCQHAAAAGNTEAQYHLGNFYAWGIGTLEDRALALRWYREAASHGTPPPRMPNEAWKEDQRSAGIRLPAAVCSRNSLPGMPHK